MFKLVLVFFIYKAIWVIILQNILAVSRVGNVSFTTLTSGRANLQAKNVPSPGLECLLFQCLRSKKKKERKKIIEKL